MPTNSKIFTMWPFIEQNEIEYLINLEKLGPLESWVLDHLFKFYFGSLRVINKITGLILS